MTSTEPLLYEKKGAWAEITFNRPDHHNAMSDRMLDLFVEAVETAVSDPEVHVAVLTGAGRSFCVGGDLDAFSTGTNQDPGPEATAVRKLRHHMSAAQLLHDSSLVTIAAVNGACAGAGLSIAAACDLRLSSSRAVYRAAFIDAGLSGDFGGSWTLTHLLGAARARELFLLNRKIDAATAKDYGLVSDVLEPDDLLTAARDMAQGLAAKAPVALGLMKLNLAQTDVPFSVACDAEAARHIHSARTDDATEAARAFLEKREPHFTGR